MKSLWLACCACAEYPQVQREIEARDAAARVLRLDRIDLLRGVVKAFSVPPTGVALYAWRAQEDLVLELLQAFVCDCEAMHVVVLTDDLDPGWIARLFHAGAEEVIAGDGDTGPRAAESAQACMGGNPERADEQRRADVEQEVEALPRNTKLAGNAMEACCEPAPQPPVHHDCARYMADAAADLDEPDSMAPVQGVQQSSGPLPWPAVRGTMPAHDPSAHRAPVVCAVAGRGGCGKTTVLATMACCAARLGLRTAVLDLDLMFGNLYELLGVEALHDLGTLVGTATGPLSEAAVVQASMRVAPRLTLWGPLAVPERAELVGSVIEPLLEVLRSESDVVLVDTSCTWTDAVAATVASCDRCLVVCDHAVGGSAAVERAVSMVKRLGVPRTRMVCMVNRLGQRACTEDAALRLEMAASLSAKARIPDGGHAVSSLLSFGRADEVARAQDAFGRSVRAYTRSLLRELGCPVGFDHVDDEPVDEPRPRLHLPWKKAGGAL